MTDPALTAFLNAHGAPAAPPDVPPDHPLLRRLAVFCQFQGALPKRVTAALRRKISVEGAHGARTSYASLLAMWDGAPGFPLFVEERLSQFEAMHYRPPLLTLINHLARIDRLPHKADGSRQLPGYLHWAATRPIASAPTETAITPVFEEEDDSWKTRS